MTSLLAGWPRHTVKTINSTIASGIKGRLYLEARGTAGKDIPATTWHGSPSVSATAAAARPVYLDEALDLSVPFTCKQAATTDQIAALSDCSALLLLCLTDKKTGAQAQTNDSQPSNCLNYVKGTHPANSSYSLTLTH